MGEFKTTGGNEGARGKYATWWNTKRVKEGVTYKELIELLGDDIAYSESYVNNAFVGKVMPKEDLITKVADIFGVPFQEAKSHFFNDWAGCKSKVPVGDMILSPKHENENENDDVASEGTILNGVISEVNSQKIKYPYRDRRNILSIVYGHIDFDMFILVDEKLTNGSLDNLLDLIYGKVTFDIFKNVIDVLEEMKQ